LKGESESVLEAEFYGSIRVGFVLYRVSFVEGLEEDVTWPLTEHPLRKDAT